MTKLLITLTTAALATAALTLTACGSSNNGNAKTGGGVFGGTPAGGDQQTSVPTRKAGAQPLTQATAWCYAYPSSGHTVQDWFQFNDNGQVTYQQFLFDNGQRAQTLLQSTGTYQYNGAQLAMNINGRALTFNTQLNNPDQATGQARLNIDLGNGQTAPYDPCN